MILKESCLKLWTNILNFSKTINSFIKIIISKNTKEKRLILIDGFKLKIIKNNILNENLINIWFTVDNCFQKRHFCGTISETKPIMFP